MTAPSIMVYIVPLLAMAMGATSTAAGHGSGDATTPFQTIKYCPEPECSEYVIVEVSCPVMIFLCNTDTPPFLNVCPTVYTSVELDHFFEDVIMYCYWCLSCTLCLHLDHTRRSLHMPDTRTDTHQHPRTCVRACHRPITLHTG